MDGWNWLQSGRKKNMQINGIRLKPIKCRHGMRFSALCACLLICSSVFCTQSMALPFGKASKDKEEDEALDVVPKPVLTKEQQKEFKLSYENGNLYLKQNNYALAQVCFLRCITLDRSSCDSHLGLAACYLATGKTEQGQLESYEALRCDPNSMAARAMWGRILMADARWDEAGGQYLQILQQNINDLSARGNLAMCLAMMGQTDHAIGHYKYILEKDPKNVMAAYNLAGSYELKNMYEEAAKYYKRVIELQPDNVNSYCSLAKCLIAKNDFKSAQTLLTHAAKLSAGKSHFVHLMQGYLYELQSQRRPAIEEYTRAVALAPKDGDCQRALARMLESGGGKIGPANNIKKLGGGQLSVSRPSPN
jgi:tetratricopeptide (TPR) repeat protein